MVSRLLHLLIIDILTTGVALRLGSAQLRPVLQEIKKNLRLLRYCAEPTGADGDSDNSSLRRRRAAPVRPACRARPVTSKPRPAACARRRACSSSAMAELSIGLQRAGVDAQRAAAAGHRGRQRGRQFGGLVQRGGGGQLHGAGAQLGGGGLVAFDQRVDQAVDAALGQLGGELRTVVLHQPQPADVDVDDLPGVGRLVQPVVELDRLALAAHLGLHHHLRTAGHRQRLGDSTVWSFSCVRRRRRRAPAGS
jgi:hypothetical protein